MEYEPTVCVLLAFLLSYLPQTLPKDPPTEEWVKEYFPNPHRNVYECGQRGRRSNVCDPNGIISYDEAVYLDTLLDSLKALPCPCDVCPGGKRGGYSIGIAFVPKLKMPEDAKKTHKKRMLHIERFATYLRDKTWNFGICNNDAVIVVVQDLGVVYTCAGSIAKDKLTSQCIDETNKVAEDKFKAENYTQGLHLLLMSFKYYFTKGGACTVGFGRKTDWPIEAVFGVVVGTAVFFIVCCVTLARFCTGAGAGGGVSSRHRHYSAYNKDQKLREMKLAELEEKKKESHEVLIDVKYDAEAEAEVPLGAVKH